MLAVHTFWFFESLCWPPKAVKIELGWTDSLQISECIIRESIFIWAFGALSIKYTSKIYMRGNTRRLGGDNCHNITLGKITRQCLPQCWAVPVPAPAASGCSSLPGTNTGNLSVNIFSKKHWSQKCKQPSECKDIICSVGACDLLNELYKGVSAVYFLVGECALSELFLRCHCLVRSWFCRLSLWQRQEKLQEHDQHSLSASLAEELFWKVCKLNTSL